MNINAIIYAGVGLFVLIVSTLLYSSFQAKKLEIANLNTAVSEYETLVAKLDASNAQSKALITKQNESISKIEVDRDSALNKLEEWRAKPPKVKYEIIYKDGEIKSNDCKDIKNRLNAVRTRDFNSL